MAVASGDAVREIERGSDEVGDLDVAGEGVGRLQELNDVGTDGVVAEEDVADADRE